MTQQIKERADLCMEIIEMASSRARQNWTDDAIEKEMIGAIKKEFPTDSFLGEETGYSKNVSEFFWVIDPIDGTKNYMDGLKLYGISIALLQNGGCVLGAVKLPSLNELFFRRADKTNIALPFKNKKTLAKRLVLISGKTELRSPEISKLLDYKERFSPRVLGSVTYSLMEFLKGNARAVLLNNTEKWDVLGSLYILEGLGAFIVDKSGKDWTLYDQTMTDFIISWDKEFLDFYLDLLHSKL